MQDFMNQQNDTRFIFGLTRWTPDTHQHSSKALLAPVKNQTLIGGFPNLGVPELSGGSTDQADL